MNTYTPTQEELIANAPEGATHYLPENKDYFFSWVKYEGDELFYKLQYARSGVGKYWYPYDRDFNVYGQPLPIHKNEGTILKESEDQSPIVVRERILDIRKQREDGLNEEKALIESLASLGFQLIDEINEKLEEAKEKHDLQDWRNWKAGDLVTFTSCTSGGFTEGRNYVVREIIESSFNQVRVVADDQGRFNGWAQKFFKFHSRPAK